MPDSSWPAIDPQRWEEVPCLSGRPATPADIAAGHAIFHLDVEGRHAEAAKLPLPRCGVQTLEDGTVRPVVVIQAEVMDGRTLLGVRYLPGGGGVCDIEEVRWVDGPGGWVPGEKGEE